MARAPYKNRRSASQNQTGPAGGRVSRCAPDNPEPRSQLRRLHIARRGTGFAAIWPRAISTPEAPNVWRAALPLGLLVLWLSSWPHSALPFLWQLRPNNASQFVKPLDRRLTRGSLRRSTPAICPSTWPAVTTVRTRSPTALAPALLLRLPPHQVPRPPRRLGSCPHQLPQYRRVHAYPTLLSSPLPPHACRHSLPL